MNSTPITPDCELRSAGCTVVTRPVTVLPSGTATLPSSETDLKTVAMYRKTLAKYFPGEQPGFVSLEGFVDAMVMVEGLKRAGKELTREGLIRGIEGIHQLDLGLGPQLKLDYSARDHASIARRVAPHQSW